MSPQFDAKPLETQEAAFSYPLIRLIEPSTRLEDWRLFVQDLNARRNRSRRARGGVIVVDSRDYIHGMFCYRIASGLYGDGLLAVDRVIVVDNFLCAGATKTLIRALETVAHTLFCSKIDIELPREWTSYPQPANGIFHLLKRAGYRRSNTCMTKTMDNARATA
jgi:hypothetical protein